MIPEQAFNLRYWNSIGTINRKAPAFLRGLLSLVLYGAGDEDRTRDPLLGKQIVCHPYGLGSPARITTRSEALSELPLRVPIPGAKPEDTTAYSGLRRGQFRWVGLQVGLQPAKTKAQRAAGPE